MWTFFCCDLGFGFSLDEGDGGLDDGVVGLFTVPKVGFADALQRVPLRDVLLRRLCDEGTLPEAKNRRGRNSRSNSNNNDENVNDRIKESRNNDGNTGNNRGTKICTCLSSNSCTISTW